MSEETDPMLGNTDQRDAYKAKIEQAMADAVKETRDARQKEWQEKQKEAVMIGATGFGGGMTSA